MMTETAKLYDSDSYISEFSATVLSCEKGKHGYDLILDRTAFFPEGGGQSADKGSVSGITVDDVNITSGVITHYISEYIAPGTAVQGRIDFDTRYRRMQGHTGEHIISGIAHELFGCTNVGFHLSDNTETIDYDVYLTDEQLAQLELLANRAIYENRTVRCWYPDADELSALDYRSKKAINEALRIVQIDGVDTCACCAPHVKVTGEVGALYIISSMRYKGGVRIWLKCGYEALDYVSALRTSASDISRRLSVPVESIADAVARLEEENALLKHSLYELKKTQTELKINSSIPTDGSIILFDGTMEASDMRHFVNATVEKCSKVSMALSGTDAEGYTFVCGSTSIALTAVAEALREQGAKCGGNDRQITGKLNMTEQDIRSSLAQLLK